MKVSNFLERYKPTNILLHKGLPAPVFCAFLKRQSPAFGGVMFVFCEKLVLSFSFVEWLCPDVITLQVLRLTREVCFEMYLRDWLRGQDLNL